MRCEDKDVQDHQIQTKNWERWFDQPSCLNPNAAAHRRCWGCKVKLMIDVHTLLRNICAAHRSIGAQPASSCLGSLQTIPVHSATYCIGVCTTSSSRTTWLIWIMIRSNRANCVNTLLWWRQEVSAVAATEEEKEATASRKQCFLSKRLEWMPRSCSFIRTGHCHIKRRKNNDTEDFGQTLRASNVAPGCCY